MLCPSTCPSVTLTTPLEQDKEEVQTVPFQKTPRSCLVNKRLREQEPFQADNVQSSIEKSEDFRELI